MGRTAYEAIALSMTTTATDHPFADTLTAGRKVVFSRTLKTAEWANTTIAAGDTAEEIEELTQGGEGTRLFDGVPASYRLDLVSSTASSRGIVELQFRRHR
jgi:dihydrofolate reductase